MATKTTGDMDPKLLGFWVRCIRETAQWSQEALAVSSGVDVRTVQRVEAGRAASISTKRALARGLGYENADIFDDAAFIRSVHEILNASREAVTDAQKREREEKFPDHIPVKVARVGTGRQLCDLADQSDGLLCNTDDDISDEAKDQAASLFDYLEDVGDIWSELAFSDRLAYERELQDMLTLLVEAGASIYIALRPTKIVGSYWTDKTPLPFTAGYVTVMKADKHIDEMMVPRRLS